MPYERLQIKFSRTPAGYQEDPAVITMHFTSATTGLLNDTIRQACETAFVTWWTGYKTTVPPYTVLDEFRWYDQQVWPTPSPLLRVSDITNAPGTAPENAPPPQLAVSVTLQTSSRARWGRFYMPGLTSQSYTNPSGRLLTTRVDAIASGAKTFLDACKTAGAIPNVWSPRGGTGPPAFAAGTALPVSALRVDDIMDIVRSRRWQSNPYRSILSLA